MISSSRCAPRPPEIIKPNRQLHHKPVRLVGDPAVLLA
jgi:hypothetical protein